MTEPTVVAVMLTRDRQAMARQAVECFRRQTYDPIRRLLLIFDSGDPSWYDFRSDSENEIHVGSEQHAGKTIGELRNIANACMQSDIIMHWDDDDISHPARMAEQVALLQASGADCVGYREALFWRDAETHLAHGDEPDSWDGQQSYLYTNTDPTFCLGTSMCYWRRTWERNPFSERNGPNPRERGEDREFLRGIKSLGVSAISGFGSAAESRMVCRIHAGNAKHYPDDLLRNSPSWRRVPEWDEKCRSIMEEACPSSL